MRKAISAAREKRTGSIYMTCSWLSHWHAFNFFLGLLGAWLVVPEQAFGKSSQVTREMIDGYLAAKLSAFEKTVLDRRCAVVVEGRVVEGEMLPYFEPAIYGQGLGRWHIGRRLWIEVVHSWKMPVLGLVSVMTHGGRLPELSSFIDVPWPVGCGSSIDVPRVAPGSNVIVSLQYSSDSDAGELWTCGGFAGFIQADLTCDVFEDEKAAALWDADVLKYLHQAEENFIKRVRDFPGQWPIYKGGSP